MQQSFSRPPRIRAAVALLSAAAALPLAACVQQGDLGRPQTSVWNDALVPATGSIVGRLRGAPVSSNPLTNDERELRQRAYRFLMPANDWSVFETALANVVRNRFLPRDLLPADATAYYRGLIGPHFLSPTSRYRRLSDDIFADRALLRPFRSLSGEVLSADRVRARAMAHVVDLNSVERQEAIARMEENVGLIAWVREALSVRICQYRYALEHLTIAAPQADAVPVERMLSALAEESTMLDRLDIGGLAGGPKRREGGAWVGPLPACRAVVYAVPAAQAAALVRKD